MAPLPTRQNCWTADRPPKITPSPICGMSAQRHRIGEGDIVADDAIMSDMAARHEIAARADPGDAMAALAAHIHRHHFAQHAARADFQPAIGKVVAPDLAVATQHRAGIDFAARAHGS